MWRNTRVMSWLVAAAVLGTSLPAHAVVRRPSKKKRSRKRRSGPKKDVVTPADAAAKRAPAQARGRALLDQGESIGAGIEFDNAAAELGDPVLYLDAGNAYYAGAQKSRDPELAKAAIERAAIALDILYFHLDSGADKDFRLVESSEIPQLIVRAQELTDEAEALIEEIEAESAEPEDEPKKKKKRGKMDRDKALLLSGALLTTGGIVGIALGVTGMGLGYARQLDAEHPAVYGEEYDTVASRGQRANTLAYVAFPVGAVLLGTGIALIVVSKKGTKGKKKKRKEEKLTFSPTLRGVQVSGRF